MLDLVFDGQIVAGREPSLVKQHLAQALKISDARLEQLFSGKQVRLKTALDQATAEKLQRSFFRLGAQTHIVPSSKPLAENQNGTSNAAAGRPDAPAALELEPIPDPVAPPVPTVEETVLEKPRFSLPTINLGLFFATTLLLAGLIMLLVFSPYPDGVIRKGLAISVLIIGYAISKIRSQLSH